MAQSSLCSIPDVRHHTQGATGGLEAKERTVKIRDGLHKEIKEILSFFKFIFNRRIIALQCCVGFCHIT